MKTILDRKKVPNPKRFALLEAKWTKRKAEEAVVAKTNEDPKRERLTKQAMGAAAKAKSLTKENVVKIAARAKPATQPNRADPEAEI